MAEDNHLSLVTEDDKRKIRVELDEHVVRQLEDISRRTGRTINDIVVEYIEKHLPLLENELK